MKLTEQVSLKRDGLMKRLAGSKKLQLSYEKVRSLEPGKTSQDEIRHGFGEPDLKSALPGSGEQVWAVKFQL
jgi:hypothetical protein